MIRFLRGALLSTLVLLAGLTHAAEKSLTIGVNNWAENIAVANLWKILLEEKGYEIKLQNADKALLYGGVAKGSIDLTFEVWLPFVDQPAYAKVKSDVELIGPWFKEANMGLAVPDYVAIDSIEQLNANKASFANSGVPTIAGIEAGSSLMGVTEKAKADYQLQYNIQISSEPGMLLTLDRAIQRKQPVVVTLWKPHWAWSKYKLHYLKDPKGVFGKTDGIYAISSKTFNARHGEVQQWLQHWQMDDNTLGSLLNSIIENGQSDPAKGTKVWINANRALIAQWIK